MHLTRKISLLLSFSLLCSLFPAFSPVPVMAAALDVNGLFETVQNGAPMGWTATGGTLSADDTDPYEGNYALKISGSDTYSASRAGSLSPGTDYTASFCYKVTGSAVPVFSVTYTGDNAVESVSPEAGDGMWQTCLHTFTTPSAITAATLSFSGQGSGTVYIDRFELWKTEEISDGGLENLWSFYQSAAGVTPGETDIIEGALDTNETDGSKCFKIQNTLSGANPYFMKTVNDISSGAEYLISVDIKSELTASSAKSGIKIQGVGAPANDQLEMSYADTGGAWQRISFVYSPVNGTTRFQLLLRLYGTGEAWFDNLSVRRTKKDDSIVSNPESLFFYGDEAVGTTYAELTTVYAPAKGGKIRVELLDGTMSLWTGSEAITSKVGVDFPISLMEIPPSATYVRDADGNITSINAFPAKPYTLRVQYVTAGGSLITEKTHTIRRYNRPTYLTKTGEFIKNGEKVLPVVGYHSMNEDLSRLSELGITVVQSSASGSPDKIKEKLDEAQKYGVKVLVPLYEYMVPAGHERNIENTKRAIRMFHDHPALFGWMVMDEPRPASREDTEMYALLQASYDLIRSHDPDHPVYICECYPSSFVWSGQCCDILALDPYPDYRDRIERVYNETVAAVEAVHGKKPVYNILQAWQWTSGWLPTSDEMRNMAYLAMLGGAVGLGYYPVHDADGNMFTQPFYSGVNSFATEEQPLVLGKTFTVTETDEAYFGTFRQDGVLYVAAASRSASAAEVTFDTGLYGAVHAISGSGTMEGTELTIPLPALGAALLAVCVEGVAVRGEKVTEVKKGESCTFYSDSAYTAMAALYVENELVELLLPGETVTASADMTIKTFTWDGMKPVK